jgi:hypothetical protein
MPHKNFNNSQPKSLAWHYYCKIARLAITMLQIRKTELLIIAKEPSAL